jgi:phage terminase large subunit GpA-like protein
VGCGHRDWIVWSNTPRKGQRPEEVTPHFHVVYNDRNPTTARIECPRCRHAVREAERMALVRAGTWQATAAEAAPSGHLGYHIPAMLSPFVTLPELVGKWLEAQHGGRESLRVFVTTSLAEPWEDEDRTIQIVGTEDAFMSGRERYDMVPNAGSLVVASTDVQDDRFEALFAAFGRRDEMWVLHHEVLGRDDGFDPYDMKAWEKLYRVLTDVRFDHACGAKLPVHTLCIDSGFQTQHAYRFSRFSPRNIFATKGVKELQDGHFIKFSRDSETANRTGVPLVLVATDTGKQRIADRVQDGRIHFPVADWCSEEFFAQLTAEACDPIFNPAGVRVGQKWVKQRPRNEILDLMVLCLAAKAIRGTLDLDAYRAQVGLPSLGLEDGPLIVVERGAA